MGEKEGEGENERGREGERGEEGESVREKGSPAARGGNLNLNSYLAKTFQPSETFLL